MAKKKTIWACTECGNESPKYNGKCFGCGEWNTLVEKEEIPTTASAGSKTIVQDGDEKPEKLKDIKEENMHRYPSGHSEFDRVLGGGIVHGSMVLIGGEPGQGKSTLLLQVATYLTEQGYKVLYFSGEESKYQTKLRAKRLSKGDSEMYVMHTRNIEDIERFCETEKPDFIIVDSIQTTGDPTIKSEPGSISQVKAATGRLMKIAKQKGITTFIVGQVSKEGEIAGPKNLEHMVDTVLYLEGEKFSDLRILRANKNRFGDAMEMGVFKMEGDGLIEIPNPSEYLLANRLSSESGSAIVCISDTRPLLVEVQCLVAPPVEGNPNPRRNAEGYSRNRVNQLCTILGNKARVPLTHNDIYVNVVGGLAIKEASADLGVLMAMYSSAKDVPVEAEMTRKNGNKDTQTVFLGEVGLTGQVITVASAERLVNEAERTGFTDCVLPKINYDSIKHKVKKIRLHPVSTLKEAVHLVFPKEK